MIVSTEPKDLEALKERVNAELNPIKYLSIDPGHSNGVCGYDEKYYLSFMFTVPADGMVDFLEIFEHVETCVIEGYKVFPNKAKQHIYSDLEMVRVIGRVESWTTLKRIELIKQPSSIKPTGYAWTGKEPLPKSDPMNHALDAHIHFMYWAVKTKRIDARSLL